MELIDEREEMRASAALRVVGRSAGAGSRRTRARSSRSNDGTNVSGRSPPRWNQRAIAESYAAVLANAIAARRRRSSSVVAPRPDQSSLEHRLVVGRSADRDHRREVLRCGAQHRGAADVDHLDDIALVELRAVDGELERIEVHADEIEELDAVLGQSREILLELAPGEDPGVHARVQRLHAPAEHLGEAGHVLDRRHRKPCLLESRRGPAARRRARTRGRRARGRTATTPVLS